MEIDAAFVRRIYRTSVVVWALVALMVHARWEWTASIGLTIGVALSLASLRALEWSVTTLIVAGADRKAGVRVAVLGVMKLFVIGAILAGALVAARQLGANLLVFVVSLLGGFVLVHLVIVLKAVGLWLLRHGAAVTPADLERIRRGGSP